MSRYQLKLELAYTVGTERRRCRYCGRWCKLGKLTKKTPLARCEMPNAAVCVECRDEHVDRQPPEAE